MVCRHFLFEDQESGEFFIAGAPTFAEAYQIALDNFEDPTYCYEMSEMEAECSGFDEY